MTRPSFMSFVTGAMLLMQRVIAAPTPDPIDAVSNVNIVGCDGPINGVADPLPVVKKALDDMFTLASVAFDALNKTVSQPNTTSLAYQHYFNDTEMPQALSMFATIKNNPVSTDWNLVVNCSMVAACDSSYFAVAGPTEDDPQENAIHICPLFFNNTSVTARTLPAASDNAGLEALCAATTLPNGTRQSANYRTYATAGHVLLRELTHLNAVGQQAGLPADPSNSNFHGTTSRIFFSNETFDASLWTARYLRDMISENPLSTELPVINSQNYALAATEQWLTENCNFSYIEPEFTAGNFSLPASVTTL